MSGKKRDNKEFDDFIQMQNNVNTPWNDYTSGKTPPMYKGNPKKAAIFQWGWAFVLYAVAAFLLSLPVISHFFDNYMFVNSWIAIIAALIPLSFAVLRTIAGIRLWGKYKVLKNDAKQQGVNRKKNSRR